MPGFPDGRLKEEDVGAILAKPVERLRARIGETDESDPVTQDLLIEITGQLEQA